MPGPKSADALQIGDVIAQSWVTSSLGIGNYPDDAPFTILGTDPIPSFGDGTYLTVRFKGGSGQGYSVTVAAASQFYVQ